MSRVQATQAPPPPWAATLLHAAVGLLLFVLLMAGALAYIFRVLAPDLLQENVRLIFERYNTPTPDPRDAGGLLLWLALGGAFFLACLGLGFWAGLKGWGDSFRGGRNVGLRAVEIALFVVLSAPVFVAVMIGYLLGRNLRPLVGYIILAVLGGALAAAGIVGLMVHPRFVPAGFVWWGITGVVLSAGFFYVACMYFRDSRGVGPLWAVSARPVARRRLHAAGLLLHAAGRERVPRSRTAPRCWSPSTCPAAWSTRIDDVPTESRAAGRAADPAGQGAGLPRRRQGELPQASPGQEPGGRLPHGPQPRPGLPPLLEGQPQLDAGGLGRLPQRPPRKDHPAPAPGDLPAEFWTAWLKPGTDVKTPKDWPADQQERFRRFLDLNDDLVEKDAAFLNNTNVGDSLLTLVDNESKKMLQGIIVFTDGRSTEGSATAFDQLREHARRDHVPIFVVGHRRGAAAGQARDRRPARAAADPARRQVPGRGRGRRARACPTSRRGGAGSDLRPQGEGQGRQGRAAGDPPDRVAGPEAGE